MKWHIHIHPIHNFKDLKTYSFTPFTQTFKAKHEVLKRYKMFIFKTHLISLKNTPKREDLHLNILWSYTKFSKHKTNGQITKNKKLKKNLNFVWFSRFFFQPCIFAFNGHFKSYRLVLWRYYRIWSKNNIFTFIIIFSKSLKNTHSLYLHKHFKPI